MGFLSVPVMAGLFLVCPPLAARVGLSGVHARPMRAEPYVAAMVPDALFLCVDLPPWFTAGFSGVLEPLGGIGFRISGTVVFRIRR